MPSLRTISRHIIPFVTCFLGVSAFNVLLLTSVLNSTRSQLLAYEHRAYPISVPFSSSASASDSPPLTPGFDQLYRSISHGFFVLFLAYNALLGVLLYSAALPWIREHVTGDFDEDAADGEIALAEPGPADMVDLEAGISVRARPESPPADCPSGIVHFQAG